MIRFYFHHTPNPMKVALFLEEAGIPYEVIPVDTFKGEQHTSTFRAINPNGKTPAIVEQRGWAKARSRFLTVMPYCFISPKNPASCLVVLPIAASCCHG